MDEDTPEVLETEDTTRIGPNDRSLLNPFLVPLQGGLGEANSQIGDGKDDFVDIFRGVVVRRKKFSRSLVFFDLAALGSRRDPAPESARATHNGVAISETYDGRGEVRLSGHTGRVLECMVRVSLVITRYDAGAMSDVVQLGAVLEVCGVPMWGEGKRHLTVHCRAIRPLPPSATLAVPTSIPYTPPTSEDSASSSCLPPFSTPSAIEGGASAQAQAEPSPSMPITQPAVAPCDDAAHRHTEESGSASSEDGEADVHLAGLRDLPISTPSEPDLSSGLGRGPGGGVGRVCRHWLNHNGRCQKEDVHGKCEWLHPPLCELPALRTAWVQERRKERAVASQLSGDVHPPSDKRFKTARAKMFADWLVSTFGREYLCSGSGALDIAGGHGDVSSCLWLQHGIPCTIIDPRDIRLRKWTYKALRKQEASKRGIRRFRGYLTAQGAMREAGEGGSEVEEVGLSEEEGRRLVQDCSVLLGMHPDQATDAIVEVAWQHRKPFAIVPCCIFARDFQHRRTPRGSVVSTYEELVEYLCTQPCIGRTGVQRHFLPFMGRNQVLFCTPSTPEAEA